MLPPALKSLDSSRTSPELMSMPASNSIWIIFMVFAGSWVSPVLHTAPVRALPPRMSFAPMDTSAPALIKSETISAFPAFAAAISAGCPSGMNEFGSKPLSSIVFTLAASPAVMALYISFGLSSAMAETAININMAIKLKQNRNLFFIL